MLKEKSITLNVEWMAEDLHNVVDTILNEVTADHANYDTINRAKKRYMALTNALLELCHYRILR